VTVFNSSREVAIRVSFLLVAIAPRAVDVDDLVLLDHALLHSSDFGGPASAFPAVVTRSTEVTIKRPILHDALHLLAQAGLVEVLASADGLKYGATEEAAAFVRLLNSQLANLFADRAEWVAERFFEGDSSTITASYRGVSDQWRVHFGEGS
jgi:hypothetical protein